jgi:AI-2 transport protein TqsA
MIPPVLIAWVTLGVPTAAIVFVAYIVINGSVENLVKPRIMGQGLNLSPLVVFVSLFFLGLALRCNWRYPGGPAYDDDIERS